MSPSVVFISFVKKVAIVFSVIEDIVLIQIMK